MASGQKESKFEQEKKAVTWRLCKHTLSRKKEERREGEKKKKERKI